MQVTVKGECMVFEQRMYIAAIFIRQCELQDNSTMMVPSLPLTQNSYRFSNS